jgi:hypothetical protein
MACGTFRLRIRCLSLLENFALYFSKVSLRATAIPRRLFNTDVSKIEYSCFIKLGPVIQQ